MSDARPVEPPVSIRAEVSLADPDTCKFAVSRTVHPGGPFFFENREQAAGSPLVERLFQLQGVAHVLVAGNVVTESPLRAGVSKRSDAEVRATVQGLLDREVNRSIASHGGQISIVDVRDGTLLIAMSGGCQGCTASQVTLKDGFELMVRRVAPEIVDIVDTTDHAAGKKPFYVRAGEGR